MVVTLRSKCTHEGHHCEVTASVSPSSSHSIQKLFVMKSSKNRYFCTDARSPLYIFVSKVTQVLVGLQMVATALRGGRDSAGGSIECESEKEVSGGSIVALSWKGNFGGTQT